MARTESALGVIIFLSQAVGTALDAACIQSDHVTVAIYANCCALLVVQGYLLAGQRENILTAPARGPGESALRQ